MSDEPVQLLVYRFGTDAVFHGQLSGALERMETGDALRVLDVVVVGLERTTGELFAVALRGGGAGGLTAALLEFRLDAGGRAAATPPALGASGEHAQLIEELAAEPEPGEALGALLLGDARGGPRGGGVGRRGGPGGGHADRSPPSPARP